MTRSRIFAIPCAAVMALVAVSVCADNVALGTWEGVWVAEADFGPRFDGPVTLHRSGDGWVADVQGERTAVVQSDSPDGVTEWTFEFPHQGHFIGRQPVGALAVTGHWIQPAGPVQGYPFASPLTLTPAGPDALTGMLRPFRQSVSLNIALVPDLDKQKPATDRYRSFLRNPERNLGVWFRIDTAVADEESITFFDRDGQRMAVASSIIAGERFTLLYPRFGRTMEFTRRPRHDAPGFYPQRAPTAVSTLLRPPQLEDGWTTAPPAATGLQEGPLIEMLNEIRSSEPEQLSSPYLHGLLIAHHGKLVFESYFHGYHREQPHDSRSAGKSLTSVLLGAAIQAGALASVDLPVYGFYGGVEAYANPDPRKERMTLRHLVTMSPGFDCDDGNYDSPGNEDRMQSQSAERDWYRYTLSLPMRSEPGSADIYCTAGINLIGGAIAKATGQSLTAFFHERLAVPLQMGRYHMNLSPTEHAYMGGGIRLRPRDFLKLGQLYLNGGTWNGQRIVSGDWVRESAAAHSSINTEDDYGYAWWRRRFTAGDGSVETYHAAGNGGQMLFVIPQLDLVVLFQAGNYSNGRMLSVMRDRYMQDMILPAALAAD
jgi:CubicO group peptidase (beta-lactamase class C family)